MTAWCWAGSWQALRQKILRLSCRGGLVETDGKKVKRYIRGSQSASGSGAAGEQDCQQDSGAMCPADTVGCLCFRKLRVAGGVPGNTKLDLGGHTERDSPVCRPADQVAFFYALMPG